MARIPFSLEYLGLTTQPFDLTVTVTSFPTTQDVYRAIVAQQPQWYEDPVYGTVFKVDDGTGYSYWKATYNDIAISDKLQDLIDIKQDIKVAIENKDVDLTGVAFGGYAGKIDEIQTQKEEQEVTVDGFMFSSGDVVVTPSTGKVMTKVTVVKDEDLVPENIVKDVNIFGVVGTAETGGGSSGGYTLKLVSYNGMIIEDLTIRQANGNEFRLYTTSNNTFENVVYIECSGYYSYSGITMAEAKAGKTLTNSVLITAFD